MLVPKKADYAHLKALISHHYFQTDWYQEEDQLYHLKAADAKPQYLLDLLQKIHWEAGAYLADRLKENQLNRKDLVILLVNGQCHIKGIAALLAEGVASSPCDGPFLSTIYVDPHYRGKGLSLDLTKMIEDEAQKRGYTHLYALTQHVGLYEKIGYRYLGPTTDQFGHPMRLLKKEFPSLPSPYQTLSKEISCLI